MDTPTSGVQRFTKKLESLCKSTRDEAQQKITTKLLDELQPKITHFRFDGITLSKGLIIKFEVEFNYPLIWDITKYWKSATYTLKIHDMEISHGKVEPCREEEKTKTTTTPVEEEDRKKKAVALEIIVPIKDVVEKLGDIYKSFAANLVKYKLELHDIVFILPFIGEHSFGGTTFEEARKVSEVLRQYCLPVLKVKTTEGYDIAVIALDLYEGNKDTIEAADEWWRLKLLPQHTTIYRGVHGALGGAKKSLAVLKKTGLWKK